jgi:sucrose phosphorylase
MASVDLEQLEQKIEHHLNVIYGGLLSPNICTSLSEDLMAIMRFDDECQVIMPSHHFWDQQDLVLITYGDTVVSPGQKPLLTLKDFLDQYVKEIANSVHILPFFPFCSDDGFAVIDFYQVNEKLGEWVDIEAISKDYRLMADLVINHGSSSSDWFANFQKGEGQGHDYFFTANKNAAISKVVRPRTNDLLRATETVNGTEYVWCTFSHEQVDFDFTNTSLLKEFVLIIRYYLDKGVRIFRLDAVAFLWKKLGTDCLNLPETHEVVRLIRTLIEHAASDALIITETNIPNRENLSYFGNGNEAHCIYNFSLPPLLVNTLITGNCRYLKRWLMSMPPAQTGTTYFNFIASHDGIGLRPAEGLLSDNELATLISTMQSFGGEISWRVGDSGVKKPYEVNIALFDALKGTVKGPDDYGMQRFICAHALMLALEGIPGLYLHSLVATGNDHDNYLKTGRERSINRHQWQYETLKGVLDDEQSQHAVSYGVLRDLIGIRKKQLAFHPNATQFTLHMGEQIFGFWRQSLDRDQSIFCLYNISDQSQSLHLSDLNLIVNEPWRDLISGKTFDNADESTALSFEPYQAMWISNR